MRIARVTRPTIVAPMVLPLYNQRTIGIHLGGRSRVVHHEPIHHLSPPSVLRLREYDLAQRRLKVVLARKNISIIRSRRIQFVQPYTVNWQFDTVALQPPLFINQIGPIR